MANADRERLTALLMARAGDCLGKGGALNCSRLADYLLEAVRLFGPYITRDKEYIQAWLESEVENNDG